MNPQQLPKISKFYSRYKTCDIEKTLGVGTTPLVARRLNDQNFRFKVVPNSSFVSFDPVSETASESCTCRPTLNSETCYTQFLRFVYHYCAVPLFGSSISQTTQRSSKDRRYICNKVFGRIQHRRYYKLLERYSRKEY